MAASGRTSVSLFFISFLLHLWFLFVYLSACACECACVRVCVWKLPGKSRQHYRTLYLTHPVPYQRFLSLLFSPLSLSFSKALSKYKFVVSSFLIFVSFPLVNGCHTSLARSSRSKLYPFTKTFCSASYYNFFLVLWSYYYINNLFSWKLRKPLPYHCDTVLLRFLRFFSPPAFSASSLPLFFPFLHLPRS